MANGALLMTKPTHIVLIDCTNADYTSETVLHKPLGGIPNGTISLSRELHARGYKVTVLNNVSKNVTLNGIEWRNRRDKITITTPSETVIIANNDPNLFCDYDDAIQQGTIPILWIRNKLNFKRFKRNARWKSYFKYRPTGVFLSHDAINVTPFYYPFKNKVIIPHFLQDRFFDDTYKADVTDPKKVFFITHPHRGLKKSVALWQKYIHPVHKDAEFHIYAHADGVMSATNSTQQILEQSNIKIMPRCTHGDLMEKLSSATAMFYPGNKDETFCFAAAEAQALGVPVITQGIGSLKERIIHGETGFVEKNDAFFVQSLNKVLSDKELQSRMAIAAKKSSQKLRANKILDQWEDLFKSA